MVLLLSALMLAGLAAAPASHAKKSKAVKGTIIVSVPAFDTTTHTSLATGFVRAKKGCDAIRIVRFAFFNLDGTPVQAGQPTVVTAKGGSFIAALPEPFSSEPSKVYVVRVAVDPRTGRSHGKKVKCSSIAGPQSNVTGSP